MGQFQVVRMLIWESPNMARVSACIISEYWRGASWTFTSQHEMTLLTYIFLILIYLSKVALLRFQRRSAKNMRPDKSPITDRVVETRIRPSWDLAFSFPSRSSSSCSREISLWRLIVSDPPVPPPAPHSLTYQIGEGSWNWPVAGG